MPRIALTCEYDGSAFVGYQIQDNGRSVQQVLTEALEKLYKEEIKITGCSRTDAGVHARGHVSSADVPFYIPVEKLPLAINALLPQDLAVKKAVYVNGDFNARFNSLGKRYVYRIYAAPIRSPLHASYAYYSSYEPDVDKMAQAAKLFEGEHDFAAFCAAGSSQHTTVRRLNSVNVERKDNTIEIEVQGEAFLYNMVRIIAGTLFYVGIGKIEVDEIADIIESRDRKRAGKTLPPEGLTLEEVYYDWDRYIV